jgi:hypothetical protein
MKPLCLLLLSAAAAFSQPFSLGVKAGLPLTDFVNAARSQNFNSTSTTNRYLFGVTGELRLPFGLGVEMDVLYRHFNFQSISLNSPTATTSTTATSGAWEFPILAKYRFKGTVVHPFVDGGVAWDKLGGLTQTVSSLSGVPGSNSSSSSRVANNTTRGFVLGGGVDVKALLIHITPEVRFTRWGAKHFIDPSGLLNSNQTQAEFLVGFTF